jgi:hypothetical protein
MSDLRFFLAHDASTPDDKIDKWRERLTEMLGEAYEDYNITVIAGRDDYKARAAESGGWKGWPPSVIEGKLWNGEPRFHGIIRPAQHVGSMDIILGKPTYEMMEGFKRLDKNCWVWDCGTDVIVEATGFARLPGDSFKQWGRVEVPSE